MKRNRLLALVILACGASAYAGPAEPSASAEPPITLDPVEINAERRAELAFRTVQLGLLRSRSDSIEAADDVVCLKQTPVGSHVAVINCATNRFWNRVRAASLANGLAGFQQSGGPAGSDMMGQATGAFVQTSGLDGVGPPRSSGPIKRADEKVVTLSLNDYNKLKKRFGELPEDMRSLASTTKP